MFKRLRFAIVTALFFLFFAASFALSEDYVSRGEGINVGTDRPGISIFPEGSLFNVENMAPGQEYKTCFTVHSRMSSEVNLSSLWSEGMRIYLKK